MIKFDAEVERQDDRTIREIKALGLPVVLWGGGDIAKNAERKLKANGINDVSCCVDIEGFPNTYTPEEIDAKLDAYIVMSAFAQAYTFEESSFDIFKHKRAIKRLGNVCDTNISMIDAAYYDEHLSDFARVYDDLADEKSRRSFDAYISAKITDDVSMMSKTLELPDYFSGDFFKLSDRESFVDCGAYIGDTIEDLLETTGGRYERIFAFEPDPDAFAKLEKFVDKMGLDDVKLIPRGAYDCATTLRFRSDGQGSCITDEGGIEIETESIDDIVGDARVTYIKMDIEGAEERALSGAAKTIKRCRPILAVCAYHRRDDLFVLHGKIKELLKDCRFYLRNHSVATAGTVLYAVPNER